MLEFLKRVWTPFRKHTFKQTGTVNMGQNSWPIYECQCCKKTLQLERWQMEDLPKVMALGCPGKPEA